MKWCTSFGTRLGLQVRDFSDCFGYFTKWDLTTSWYLEITSRHEISLRVLKNISRVSPPFELFYDEFKVTKCCTKTFCLCWVLRSKIAFMRCVTFSNVLYVFGLFMKNYLGHVYISAWVSRFASVTEMIKYVEKLLLFACLVFSRILC